jgi:hypothetical protein
MLLKNILFLQQFSNRISGASSLFEKEEKQHFEVP